MPTRTPTSMAHPRSSPNENTFIPPTVAGMLGTSSKSDSSFDTMPEAASFQSPTKRLNLPCHLIKPHTRNERFWPRDEALEAIKDVLLPTDEHQSQDQPPGLRTFVLHGMGGVGKTEVATEFVYRHKDEYDVVFFLHADRKNRIASEFLKAADMLGLGEITDVDAACDAVKDWLADPVKTIHATRSRSGSFRSVGDASHDVPDYAKWLIVFDNADDPEILFKYYWPRNGRGSILVTSRDPMAKNNSYFVRIGYELEKLSNDEAAAFLRTMADHDNTPGTEETAKAIASSLDGLPLAIEQIGAYISLNNLSFRRFLSMYKDDRDLEKLQDLRFAKGRGYEYSIAGVFALEHLSLDSLALLNITSFLDPDRIHSRLLVDNLAAVDLKSYPTNEIAFDEAISRLRKRALVSRGLNDSELRVHRLVQDVTRALMRKNGTLESCFDTTVNLLWTDFPKITRGGVGRAQKIDRWTKCDELFPHISRLREFYESYTGDKKIFKSQRKFADLLNEAGWYQHERTNPSDTTPVVELAQQICEESEADCTEQLALIFGTRTWSCALMKQFDKVIRFADERLELEQKMFEKSGKITANLASAYNDKAAAYSMNKLPSKAFALIDESQRLREALPGFKPEHRFSPFHERGLAYWLQGEYVESADWLLKALRDRTAALEENDRQSVRTGQLYYALGNTRSSQAAVDLDSNLLAESAMWHQKALLHFRVTAGDNHYRTACACFRVAEHCIRNRQYDIGRDALDQALKVFQSRSYYQQEHSRTCFLYHKLHRLEGNAAEAQAMLDKSVKAFNGAFPHHALTINDRTRDDFASLCTYDF